MEIRQARADDDAALAHMIYSAGPELYDFIYRTRKHDALDYIRYEFESGRGFCGHRNVTVATQGHRVVGTGCFFDARRYGKLTLGTLANMIRFYGWKDVWSVLARSGHIGSVMKKPRPGELYLSNFGVAPDCRRSGVGSAMIQHKLNEARQQGYRVFGLDVADTNPQAERLYQRLGLQQVAFKRFSGKRQGMQIPNAKKMELKIAP